MIYKNVPDLIGYISKNLPIKSTEQDEAEDEIFRSLHLVRSLGGLEERDFDRYTDGKFDLLKSLIAHDNERNFAASEQFEFNDNDHGSAPESEESSGSEYEDLSGSEEDEDDSDDSEYYDDDEPKILKGKKYEDKDVKKLRKQEAKDTKREKRKTKVKKHIKKKLVKKTKSKK